MEKVKSHSPTSTESKKFSSVLRQRRWLSDDTFELMLDRPKNFGFEPGQRIRFLYESLERDYSITSARESDDLSLCIRKIEGGAFSTALSKIDEGTGLEFTGPHGYFTYKPSNRIPVFIATGTGIAPFVSMCRSLEFKYIMLQGARSIQGLRFNELFQSRALRYIPCLSKNFTTADLPKSTFIGRVTDYLSIHLEKGDYDFYLCGNSEMIREAILIIDLQFPDSRIFTEIYY